MNARTLYSMRERLLRSRAPQCSAAESMSQNVNAAIFVRNQLESPLLRLPAELRNRIYTLLFSSLPILICFATSHATRLIDRCSLSTSNWRRWSHMHYSRRRLTLTEVCRQTYIETRLLPFLLNTFTGYPEAVLSAFPGRLYRAQLSSITTVHITVQSIDICGELVASAGTKRVHMSWELFGALKIWRRLPGLRTLRVDWEGGLLHDDLWARFEEELARKVFG